MCCRLLSLLLSQPFPYSHAASCPSVHFPSSSPAFWAAAVFCYLYVSLLFMLCTSLSLFAFSFFLSVNVSFSAFLLLCLPFLPSLSLSSQISYALYCMHWPVLVYISWIWTGNVTKQVHWPELKYVEAWLSLPVWMVIPSLIVCILCATAVYWLLEKPARHAINRRNGDSNNPSKQHQTNRKKTEMRADDAINATKTHQVLDTVL